MHHKEGVTIKKLFLWSVHAEFKSLEDPVDDCRRHIHIVTNKRKYSEMVDALKKFAGSQFKFNIIECECLTDALMTSEAILEACYRNYYKS